MGDKYGYSKPLKLSLFMMSIPTFMIGMLPTYNDIGYWSIALLAILRIIQGFAAGGELPIAACYIYEASTGKYRGFLCSSVTASSLAGVTLGSIVATLLYLSFDQET